MSMAPLLQLQTQEAETNPQSKMIRETSHICKLWVCLKIDSLESMSRVKGES